MNPPASRKLTSREYLVPPAAGSPDACDSVHRQASGVLRSWYTAGLIQGYVVRVLSTPEDIVDEDLRDFGILEVTDGRLPVVWLNVTYNPANLGLQEREEFEHSFGLHLLCETESLD